GHHAIFDPAMLDTPKINDVFKAQQNENEHKIIIKRHNKLTTISYPFNPLDAVGWHGDLSVVRINWRDIRPVMSHRYHLAPSAHTTFVSRRFVVCTFCPRPIESDPGALKVPFFHNNDDYEEVIFYHQGEFFSRDNIHPGMLTLHPSGLTHGPHPKALQTGLKSERKETDEVAVMIDTRDELFIDPDAEKIEWPDYVHSWRGENT
ncbi:MAG: homogentisate 1,2-dioxygenase, partial [Gammaproteobacteria bacterium]|nr:homogentisate 1,2-dioxygenase [Gammaproteobacteria bacterium]